MTHALKIKLGATEMDETVEYQFTRKAAHETAKAGATAVVGPFYSLEQTRAAIVEDLVRGRPRMRPGPAERFAETLFPEWGEETALVGRTGVVYSIQRRPHARAEDAERVRRGDSVARSRSGVVMVHLETLLEVMAEHVPEPLRGEERDGYAEALCDIPIHVRAAAVEHDLKSGKLEPNRYPTVQVDVVGTLGSRWERTGVWSRGEGSSDAPDRPSDER